FDIIEHEQLCRDAVLTCMLSYEATLEITRSAKCDLAYVFNGRFCGPRGILRALQAEAVEYRIHERGCDMFHYCLMTDVPHNRTYIQKHIRSLWKAYHDSAESRRSRARQFFNKRREGASTGWLSYTSHQDHSVPEELLRSHRLVSYFASSDDEFLAIGDAFDQWGFKTQAEAVLALIAATEARPHCHLVIRVHPGLRDKSADARKFWENLKTHERCTVLTADSPVRTYDLIDASDLVVTYGSTVGVEANHQGKPSLLLGSAFYDELGVAHTVFSTAELAEFLSDPEKWKVHDETGALMYGFYSAAHGIPFEYYTPSTLFSGRFKDDELFAARGPLSKFSFGGLAGKFRKKCGTIIGQLRSVVATRR
ncbi:MAG: hypothetical protein MK102_19920, partial [Fuerstiella sp.]|nr:hypothetical protein [Fuerstiella sp.]